MTRKIKNLNSIRHRSKKGRETREVATLADTLVDTNSVYLSLIFVQLLWLVNPHILHQKKGRFLTECMSQISITDSKVKWLLCFIFRYVQPVTQHYKRSTGRRNDSTWNQSSHHGNTDDHYKETIILLSINTFGCQKKERRTKVSLRCMHCTYGNMQKAHLGTVI